jgi:serine/threonine protein kinase
MMTPIPDDDATRMNLSPGASVTTPDIDSVKMADVQKQAKPDAELNQPVPSKSSNGNVLPIGTRIGEFDIIGVIGVGGFGIAYLAHDQSLQRTVALKEYMPAAFAMRTDQVTVCVSSDEYMETFAAGLKSFVNEAHLLAQFDHPSLVKVYRFWEANGTAYMVMPFYEGPTLKARLAQMAEPPDEAWLKEFLRQIFFALEIIHAKQCFHRDIAPDNILMLEGDRPVLLDFGAARRVIEGREQALTVILKAGYAPIEQYGNDDEMSQGPWTDLYALASVVYYTMMGKVPPQAVQRVIGVDPYKPLVEQAKGRYSEKFLSAIDAAMALRPKDRPQSVAHFRELLDLEAPTMSAQRAAAFEPIPMVKLEPKRSEVNKSPVTETTPPKSKAALIIGAIVVMSVLGAGAWLWQSPIDAPESQLETQASAKMPVPAPIATVASSPDVSATVKIAPVAAPPAVVLPVFEPLKMLTDVVAGRDTLHEVEAKVASNTVKISKDDLRFTVRSSKPGYVYVLMLDTERQHLYLMFPNASDKNNKIVAGKAMSVPGASSKWTAQGPAGLDQFVVMVSDYPRDFKAAGWQAGDPIGEFSMDIARRAFEAKSGSSALFAGEVACAANAQCSNSYGAANFAIEEMH